MEWNFREIQTFLNSIGKNPQIHGEFLPTLLPYYEYFLFYLFLGIDLVFTDGIKKRAFYVMHLSRYYQIFHTHILSRL